MFSLFKSWYLRHFSQPGTIEFALVLLASFLVVYYFMWLVGPIVVALCLAYCLDWPVDGLVKKLRMSRHLASIVVMTIFCSLCVFITVLIVPLVIKQGAELYDTIMKFNHPVQQNILDENYNNRIYKLYKQNNRLSANDNPEEMSHIPLSAVESHFQPFALQSGAPLSSNLPNLAELTKQSATQESGNNTQFSLSLDPNKDQEEANSLSTSKPQQGTELTSSNFQDPTNSVQEVLPSQANYNHELLNNQLAEQINANDSEWSLQMMNHNTTFKLSGSDFDLNVAHEIYSFVDKLPEPITNWLTIEYLENLVYNARITSTNKIANLIKTQIAPSVVNAFTWLMYLIIVPIFTFLMLYNKQELKHRFKTFVLPNNQSLMQEFWPSMHSLIAGYIRGKILHIIIISIANTLAFMLMGVNYALLLGVGVGLSVVIPYVGAVIIAIPVILVATFQFGFSTTLIWVLVVYVLIQLLDSNVLTPALFSKALNLDAFSILSAILIFGGLWGFWGVFFAIPLATFIKTLIVRWPSLDAVPSDGRVDLNAKNKAQNTSYEVTVPAEPTPKSNVRSTIHSYFEKINGNKSNKQENQNSNKSTRI